MMYVLGAMYGLLIGGVTGWFMYNACAGSKKEKIQTAILWGVGMGIICVACAFSG